MRRKLPELQNALLLWLVWAVTPSMSVAQVNPPANTPGKLTTTVEVEVLMSPFTSGIAAQQWGEALGKLNVTVSVRQPVFDDELGVSESVHGTLRRVKVVGQLDEQRRLVLPERSVHTRSTRAAAGMASGVADLWSAGGTGGAASVGADERAILGPVYRAQSGDHTGVRGATFGVGVAGVESP